MTNRNKKNLTSKKASKIAVLISILFCTILTGFFFYMFWAFIEEMLICLPLNLLLLYVVYIFVYETIFHGSILEIEEKEKILYMI